TGNSNARRSRGTSRRWRHLETSITEIGATSISTRVDDFVGRNARHVAVGFGNRGWFRVAATARDRRYRRTDDGVGLVVSRNADSLRDVAQAARARTVKR